MKTKQRNIRVFEIECDDVSAVEKYITKNKALIEGLLVLLKGSKAKECADFCKSEDICYAIMGECGDNVQTAKKPTKAEQEQKDLFNISEDSGAKAGHSAPQERVVEKIVEVEKIVLQTVYVEKEPIEDGVQSQKSDRVIKYSTVRSGEDIVTDGDVSVFARVNSGAKIKAEGCVEIFDTIDGLVECNGSYMIIRKIDKGTVVFNSHTLEPIVFNGKLKRVAMVGGKLEITEL